MRLIDHLSARRSAFVACAAAITALAAGCGPGSDASENSVSEADQHAVTDPAKLGTVTLTEWDKNTDGASDQWMQKLNERFESLYPNITIDRVARSFDDLKRTLKLALSSGSPPDVVQVNQGYGDLGAFANAGLLTPIDGYAEEYGWVEDYPATLLDQNRSTSSGGWGSGDLYGVSSAAEITGVYYNNELLGELGLKPPTTYSEFVDDVAKANQAGMLPIQFGNSDQVQAIHLLGLVLTNLAGPEMVNDLVYGREGASWEAPEVVEALQTLADWSEEGALPSDANGQTQDRALANFEAGDGVFFISGSWYGGDLAQLGSKLGFVALTPDGASEPVAMGGLGLPWAIPSGAEQADAAAAYIDFLASPEAAAIIAKEGEIPANSADSFSPPAQTVTADLTSAMQAVLDADTMVPYLDYATTDFFTVLGSQLQELVAGQSSAEDVASALQSELESFQASR